MTENVIIIPTRLEATRLPNKPMKKINNKEMILHVYEAAKKANIGEVIVASPNQEIYELVTSAKGICVKTKLDHKTGTDRIFEVFDKFLKRKPQTIINLQGDMPNIHPETINYLIDYMYQGKCEIGTIASKLSSNSELNDENIVKVLVKEKLKPGMFVEAKDFVRINNIKEFQAYHHIGIYAFTNKGLLSYVGLKRSKLELKRKLEQLRAMENGMSIHVGYVESSPLSVDTKKDLEEIKKLMERNE